MTESPLVSPCKPAASVLFAAMLALTLSACGSNAKFADLDEKVRRAEAAAQKAVAAQHAAESAVARMRHQENNDRRGEGDDEESNFQDGGPPPLAGGGDSESGDAEEPKPEA